MAIATRTTTKGIAAVGRSITTKPAAKTTVMQAHESVMTVTTTILEGGTIKGEPVEQQEREVKLFATNPAHTGVTLGYNKNLGNVEMAKVQVFVSMPHYVEEADTAFQQVLEKAKANLDAAIAELGVLGEVAGTEDVTEAVAETTTEGEAEASGGDNVTPEYLDAADHDTLVAVAEGNPDLGVTPGDYASDDDLREVLKSVIFPEEETSSDEPFTQEQFEASTTEDLKAQWDAWEMGKWPPGNEKLQRKAAIKRLLEKQEEMTAAQ